MYLATHRSANGPPCDRGWMVIGYVSLLTSRAFENREEPSHWQARSRLIAVFPESAQLTFYTQFVIRPNILKSNMIAYLWRSAPKPCGGASEASFRVSVRRS